MIHPVRLDGNHKYWTPRRDGELQVPGYSEICAALGVTKPNPFYTHEGREKGIAIHAWGSFHAQGKTATAEPDERIRERVEQVKRFLSETKFVLAGTERSMYDPVNGFACTPDLYGSIGLWQWVIDLKSGGKVKSHPLQTAAQAIALKANGFRPQKRGAAYLKDGTYRLVEHSDIMDEVHWKAIVAGYHLMTPEQRAVFASEEFPLRSEVFKTMTDAQRRIISNAHAARSFYL